LKRGGGGVRRERSNVGREQKKKVALIQCKKNEGGGERIEDLTTHRGEMAIIKKGKRCGGDAEREDG